MDVHLCGITGTPCVTDPAAFQPGFVSELGRKGENLVKCWTAALEGGLDLDVQDKAELY